MFRFLILSFVIASFLAPPANAEYAGSSAGSAGVSDGGSANYQIPFVIPPGTGGMQPAIGLEYSSHRGNGIAGMGWALSGLSSVTRCPRRLDPSAPPDSSISLDPVDFDDNDLFCLEGRYLVAIDGDYGAHETKYRAEIDTFAKIESFGQAGVGPAFFRVTQSNGVVFEYGSTEDSRIEASGRDEAYLWALAKVQDPLGNFYTITYNEDSVTGEFSPARIDYTGNETASLSPYNHVEFNYELRPDLMSAYVSTSEVRVGMRLSSVQTYSDATLVRDYRLSYVASSAGSGRSLLTEIQECDGQDVCVAPNTFDYQESDGWSPPTSLGTELHGANWTNWEFERVSGDFDGNGTLDLYLLGKNESYFCSGPEITGLDSCVITDVDGRWKNDFKITSGDFNGDGISDLFLIGNPDSFFCYGPDIASSSNNCELTAEGQNFKLWFHQMFPGDYDGDGITDLLMIADTAYFGAKAIYLCLGKDDFDFSFDTSTNSYFGCTEGIFPGPIQYTIILGGGLLVPGDYNSDGRTDLIFVDNDSYYCSGAELVTWLPTDPEYIGLPGVADGKWIFDPTCTLISEDHWQSDYDLNPGDFNADGVQDILLIGRDDHIFCPGPSVTQLNGCKNPVASRWKQDYDRYFATDFNGDGFTDLLLLDDSNGGRFCEGPGLLTEDNCVAITSDDWVGQYEWDGGDFNTDGSTDLFALKKGGGVYFLPSESQQIDTLIRVTDGLGEETLFEYSTIEDSDVYVRGTGSTYPYVDLTFQGGLVKKVSRSNGAGGYFETAFRYGEARVDNLRGEGQGFRWVESTDLDTGIQTTDYKHQDYPYTSLSEYSEKRLADDTLIGRTVNIWNAVALDGGTHYSVQLSGDTNEAWELDGSLVSSKARFFQYDAYANPTNVASINDDGWEQHTQTTYTQDLTGWFLGLATQVEVTSTTPSDEWQTRTTSYEYESGTGFLERETIELGTALELVRDFTHDAFGNVTSTTVSGADITSRTGSIEFDARGQFAEVTTNELGHQETRTYDPRFGVVTSLLGPNDLMTTWGYDELGRPILDTRPDATTTTTTYINCAEVTCGFGAASAIQVESTGSAPATVYYDFLGRKIVTESVSFDGSVVLTEMIYDTLGNVSDVSRPYFEGGIDFWTHFTYDVLGRRLTQTAPDNSVSSTVYDGRTTTQINGLNQSSTAVADSLGNLVESIDALDQSNVYTYGPFAVALSVTDPKDNSVVTTYDALGRKLSTDDPDMGLWSYSYNALGELISQQDAKGFVTNFEYDLLGRMTSRVTQNQPETWEYDTAANGIGSLAHATAAYGYDETHSYDALSRPASVTRRIGGQYFTASISYDSLSRVDEVIYPTGFAVQNSYNARGHLEQVKRSDDQTVVWQLDSTMANGDLAQVSLGNGLTTGRDYDQRTERLEWIGTSTPGGYGDIQILQYEADVVGNLTRRTDWNQWTASGPLSEYFEYDALNRMTRSYIATVHDTAYTYDEVGNLTSKTTAGNYVYGANGAGPGQLTSVSGVASRSYNYDANGNPLSDGQRSYVHTAFNKPLKVTGTAGTTNFFYDANRQKVMQNSNQGGWAFTRYVGSLYEKHSAGGVDRHKHYIFAAGEMVAVHTESGATESTHYLHKDHLGSIDVITDEDGQVLERLSYDAHGQRRNIDWSFTQPITNTIETRGFTGHEHLDQYGLINMQARIYDPVIGRFLEADPTVQHPGSTQGYARYAYAGNNPLRYTDPTGYGFFSDMKDKLESFHDKFKAKMKHAFEKARDGAREVVMGYARWAARNQAVTMIINVVVSVVLPGIGPMIAALNQSVIAIGLSRAAGGHTGDVLSALGKVWAVSLVGAGVGYGAGYAASGMAEPFTTAGYLAAAVAGGAAGGALSAALNGGNIGEGMLYGAATGFVISRIVWAYNNAKQAVSFDRLTNNFNEDTKGWSRADKTAYTKAVLALRKHIRSLSLDGMREQFPRASRYSDHEVGFEKLVMNKELTNMAASNTAGLVLDGYARGLTKATLAIPTVPLSSLSAAKAAQWFAGQAATFGYEAHQYGRGSSRDFFVGCDVGRGCSMVEAPH